MAQLLYANQFVVTALNVGGGINDTQTTGIILADVSLVDTTKPGMVLIGYANPLSTTTAEWVEYTSINGSKELVGVTRGAEGYSAKTHDNNVSVAFPLTESHINRINEKLNGSDSGVVLLNPTINGLVSGTALSSGWISYSTITPTTGSFDAPSYPVVFAGVDLSTTLYPGMRVKITQGTVKYFIITKISFSTDTTVTLYGGTDYSLVASGTTAISAFSYSPSKAPAGFPLDSTKWTVEVTDTSAQSQSSPSASTWYNPGSIAISIPIGIWRTNYQCCAKVAKATTTIDVSTTLSTANNSASDADFTSYQVSGASASQVGGMVFREKILVLTSKTSYYLNISTFVASTTSITLDGTDSKTIIRAISAYL